MRSPLLNEVVREPGICHIFVSPGGFWTPGWAVRERRKKASLQMDLCWKQRWVADKQTVCGSVSLLLDISSSGLYSTVSLKAFGNNWTSNIRLCVKVALCDSADTSADQFHILSSSQWDKMNCTATNRNIDDIHREGWIKTHILCD